MLRIIAGKYRGRKIEVPENGTVPTKDRVREAVFSSLGERIVGANVFDAFAGSGAYGIEALSRGAKRVLFSDTRSIPVVEKNLALLGEANGALFRGDALKAIETENEPFDLVFLDPPYAEKHLYGEILRALEERSLLTPHSRAVLEYEGECPIDISPYAYAREKKYGYTKILVIGKE